MAHGYWVNVKAYSRDEDIIGEGKVFLFSHGRDEATFLEEEVYDRDDYYVDWKQMRAAGTCKYMDLRKWHGAMTWGHDIVEGERDRELGAECEAA